MKESEVGLVVLYFEGTVHVSLPELMVAHVILSSRLLLLLVSLRNGRWQLAWVGAHGFWLLGLVALQLVVVRPLEPRISNPKVGIPGVSV